MCSPIIQNNLFIFVVFQIIVTGGSLQDCKDALNLAVSDG
jgi:hypothetical protein